jgi:hypothetical protein
MTLDEETRLENRKNEIVERLAQLDQLIDAGRTGRWVRRTDEQLRRQAALVSESRRITQESAGITAELRRLRTIGGRKTRKTRRRYKKRNKN